MSTFWSVCVSFILNRKMRTVSLPVGCNAYRKRSFQEWTYLIFNDLFVYFRESVEYKHTGRKYFLATKATSPIRLFTAYLQHFYISE